MSSDLWGHIVDGVAPIIAISVAYWFGHRRANTVDAALVQVHGLVDKRLTLALARIEGLTTESASLRAQIAENEEEIAKITRQLKDGVADNE